MNPSDVLMPGVNPSDVLMVLFVIEAVLFVLAVMVLAIKLVVYKLDLDITRNRLERGIYERGESEIIVALVTMW